MFSKKKLPENGGNHPLENADSSNYVDKYYLVFNGMEGEPTYELEASVTIGSGDTNIVLDDESISPKHCTFVLNQDVVSVMDHASVLGTFINKKKVEPGRFYILQPSDKLKIGNIPFHISLIPTPVFEEDDFDIEEDILDDEEVVDRTEEFDLPPNLPEDATLMTKVMTSADLDIKEAPVQEEEDLDLDDLGEDEFEEDILEFDDELENEDEQLSLSRHSVDELRASGSKNLADETLVFKITNKRAPNALVRIVSILLEILFIVILLSFVGKDPALNQIASDIGNEGIALLKPLYMEHAKLIIDQVVMDVPALKSMGQEVASFYNENSAIGLGILLFFVLRISTALLLGVSIGQFFLGVHSTSNHLVRRISGVIREVVGVVTFPFFFIFDLSTLFSRRSLKEVLSGSSLESLSLIKTSLLVAIVFPLSICFFLVSPLIQGLDFKTALTVDGSFQNKKKVEIENIEIQSSYFSFEGNVEAKYVFPSYTIVRNNKKKILKPQVTFVDRETSRGFQLSKIKTFSLKKLLASSIENNFLAKEKFSNILSATTDIAYENKNFKGHSFGTPKFNKEILEMAKASFSLSFETLIDHVQVYGPFIGGFVNFRSNLESIIKNKIISITGGSINSVPFLFVKTQKGIVFFPLDKPEVSLYQTSFLQVKKLRTEFNQLRFKRISLANSSVQFGEFVAMDFILTPQKMKKEFFQIYYEFLYNKGSEILSSKKENIIPKFITSLKSTLKAVKLLGKKEVDKFEQNLADLIKALENNDRPFFQLIDDEIKTVSVQ